MTEPLLRAWIYELSDRGAERVEYDATDRVLRQLFS
jgi:hypothetical protein